MHGVPGIEDVQPSNVSLPRKYGYIRTKACLYLQRGPDYYRQQDFFSMPSEEWSDTEIQLLERGCRQVQNWMGGSPDRPLTGLGIHGFYNLMYLFHYERKEQALVDDNPDVMLDRIEFTHSVNGDSIILYNAVGKAFEPKFTINITEVNVVSMSVLRLISSKTTLNIADCKRLLNVLPVTIPAQISGDDIDSFANQLAEQGVVAQVVLAEDHRYPFRYDIRITSAHGERFQLIRQVSQLTNKSLVEAKHIVNALPCALDLDLTFEETRRSTKDLNSSSFGFEVISKANPLRAYREVENNAHDTQLVDTTTSRIETAFEGTVVRDTPYRDELLIRLKRYRLAAFLWCILVYLCKNIPSQNIALPILSVLMLVPLVLFVRFIYGEYSKNPQDFFKIERKHIIIIIILAIICTLVGRFVWGEVARYGL
jgi:ribosomal protein L7/L12